MQKKSILITGCSSGIGLTTATLLKERGHRVFASARKMADVETLRGQGFESLLLDVNDLASMQAALDTIQQKTGGTLDALFNNAGYLQAGAIQDLTRDLIRAQFETNVFGAMELTRLVLPIMQKQGHGRIIQNSSVLGLVTIPYCGAYNASKFALEGFSNTLRQELQGTNIHVAIINPGAIESALRKNAYDHFKNQFHATASPYQQAYQRLEANYFDETRSLTSKKSIAVAKKVRHALESTHPHARYYVGWTAASAAILRRFLPDTILDFILTQAR